ncbi:hypothetical protein DCC81_20145 [Chitinophaga parva]|uniref:VCBS repeat-containing protein n=1 Tax=Chitinophaga parva TaxID=2169414 RepID=A0A2T7BCE7_9BACT|nr:hypothetical protein [Chitinophaga parva]PUZ22745.1 hypothetical protein DCC81_20145 [Chitinophaga parva]
MKKLTLAALVLFCCCHVQTAPVQSTPATPPPVADTTPAANAPSDDDPAWDTTFSDYDVPFTDTLNGDFNGDGQTEMAFTVRTVRQRGNPMENGSPGAFEVHFSDTTIPALPIGCCEARLVPEGDLNHDNADDFSVFMEPQNGNTYWFSTYTFKNKKWEQVMDELLVPTGGDFVPDSDLLKRVSLENDTLYYYDNDFGGEDLHQLIRKKVTPPTHP